MSIWSQNLHGLKSIGRLEEFFDTFRRRRVFAACVQETWRVGSEDLVNGDCVLLSVGLSETEQSTRGSQGVGVVLSRAGQDAWAKADHEVHRDFGARVMAVRLVVHGSDGREFGLFLVSAYAPIGCAPPEKWDAFFAGLDVCIARKRTGDVLFLGVDSNSSMGIHSNSRMEAECKSFSPIGCFGLSHINDSGRRFHSYLATREYAAVSTWFPKRSYGTWIHPRSRLQHQLDHVVTEQRDKKKFLDCGVRRPLIGSDHRGICARLCASSRVKKTSCARRSLLTLDYSYLGSGDDCRELREKFASRVGQLCLQTEIGPGESRYDRLACAMDKAAHELLPKRERAEPGFFESSQDVLRPLIDERNEAMRLCFSSMRASRTNTSLLHDRRKRLKRAVEKAKSDWIISQMDDLNGGANAANGFACCWDALKQLKAGLSKTRKAPPKKMRKQDGSLASSPEENAAVFASHFEKLYGREASFDWSVLDDVPQHSIRADLDEVPSDLELHGAIHHLRNTAPGLSGLKAAAWKAITASSAAFAEFRAVFMELWQDEIMPESWNSGLLAVLPKKGDLSDPSNHRGIMMLEVAYKVVAIVLHRRLTQVCETLDHESQCGFRPHRGTVDGIFSLKLALKKRREHGCESWVYFLDLVKAFDRVPRAVLWLVLAKLGVPPKIVNLLKLLHQVVKVKFSVDGVDVVLDSIIGVKQGDILGPILFVMYMAAVSISWRKTHRYDLCVFRSKPDWVLSGRRFGTGKKSDEFAFSDSLYADDTAMLFCSREDVEVQCPKVNSHFGRWGMEVHARTYDSNKPAKSEVLFVAAPGIQYVDKETFSDECEDGVVRPRDLSPIDVGNGTCPVVDRFKYLGSLLHQKCRDAADVDERIKKAGGAFAALRGCVFDDRRVNLTAKRAVYVSLILAILLYSSECWCLTEVMFKRLRCFHAKCVRKMSRITRKHMWSHLVSDAELRLKLNLESIDEYISRRQLSWAGTVARMPFCRLPRKMLSSWVCAPRPIGAPQFTYARGLHKALAKKDIERASWHQKAQDPASWRALIGQHTP